MISICSKEKMEAIKSIDWVREAKDIQPYLDELNNNSIQELNLADHRIGDEECEHLSKALLKNTSLKIFNLEANYIGDQGADYLAQALEKNTTLQLLGLNANYIGNKGIESLARALSTNASLQQLHLNFNEIRKQGCESLAQALLKNTTLQELDISYQCGIKTNMEASLLCDAVKKNPSLKQLYGIQLVAEIDNEITLEKWRQNHGN